MERAENKSGYIGGGVRKLVAEIFNSKDKERKRKWGK